MTLLHVCQCAAQRGMCHLDCRLGTHDVQVHAWLTGQVSFEVELSDSSDDEPLTLSVSSTRK